MKNLGQMDRYETHPYDADSRSRSGGIYCRLFAQHLDIWTLFGIWVLAFELYPSFASMQQSVGLQGSQKQMADDETNRMYFNNLIGRPTYAKEHLNLGKSRDFCETNPSQLRRVTPPPLTARKSRSQTNETNHT
jgi:hypothetical protein